MCLARGRGPCEYGGQPTWNRGFEKRADSTKFKLVYVANIILRGRPLDGIALGT